MDLFVLRCFSVPRWAWYFFIESEIFCFTSFDNSLYCLISLVILYNKYSLDSKKVKKNWYFFKNWYIYLWLTILFKAIKLLFWNIEKNWLDLMDRVVCQLCKLLPLLKFAGAWSWTISTLREVRYEERNKYIYIRR